MQYLNCELFAIAKLTMTGGTGLAALRQKTRAAQDREERAKWGEDVKIANIDLL